MTVRINKPALNLREKLAELDKPSGIVGEQILRSDTAEDAREALNLEEHLFEDFESTGIDDNATSTKVTVSDSGVDVDGDISLDDNNKVTLGTGDDLQIYHDGSNSYVKDTGTGNLWLQGSSQVNIGGANGTVGVQVNEGSSTALRHNNAVKFTTTSTGVDVTGTVTADGLTVDGLSNMTGDRSGGSVGGTTLIKGSYTYGHHHFNLGSMYSNGANLLGYGVESSKSASNSFISTLSNYSAPRSALTSGQDINFFTASAQNTAVGSPVAMSKRLKIANNGNVSFYEDTGTTAKMVWSSSDESLGLGTSVPLAKIHIQDDLEATANNNYSLVINGLSTGDIGDSSSIYLGAQNSTLRGSVIASEKLDGSNAHALLFSTSSAGNTPTERARLDSSGNLLVGGTSAYAVNATTITSGGTVYSSVSGGHALEVNRNTNDGDVVRFNKDGSTVGSIGAGGGDLTIGNQEASLKFNHSSNIIHPNGTGTGSDGLTTLGWSNNRFKDLYLSGGVITSSDYRLKEDIQPMQSYADTVKQMNLVNFAWKESGEREDGFIAHELQALVPNAVRGNKDAVNEDGEAQYQGVDPLKLIPVLTKALQEALERIETLENN